MYFENDDIDNAGRYFTITKTSHKNTPALKMQKVDRYEEIGKLKPDIELTKHICRSHQLNVTIYGSSTTFRDGRGIVYHQHPSISNGIRAIGSDIDKEGKISVLNKEQKDYLSDMKILIFDEWRGENRDPVSFQQFSKMNH